MKLKEAVTELKEQRLSIEKVLKCTEGTLKNKVGGVIYDNSIAKMLSSSIRYMYENLIETIEDIDRELQRHIEEYKEFFCEITPTNCYVAFEFADKLNEDQYIKIKEKEGETIYTFYSNDYPRVGEFLERLCNEECEWEDFIEYLN